jgi:hypothetical protein
MSSFLDAEAECACALEQRVERVDLMIIVVLQSSYRVVVVVLQRNGNGVRE